MNSNFVKTLLLAPLARILPFFLVVPFISLILKRFDIALALDVNLMIANMLCCSCLLLVRAIMLLRRFGAAPPAPPIRHELMSLTGSSDGFRQQLHRSGYRLSSAGNYAEKGLHSAATAAAMLALTALLLLGSYDNLFQFGGVVLVGTGDPSLLYDPAAYTMYSRGPFARIQSIGYKLKGVNRIMPNSSYPYGAAELRLTDRHDKQLWQGTLAALGAAYTHDGYIFAMNSLEYNIGLLMLVDGNHIVYGDWIHLVPMAKPVPGFTHEGTLKRDKLNDVEGTALYNDVTERLQLRLRFHKEPIEVELGEAPNHEKQAGKYKIINQGTARQSQVRISRVRHTVLLLILAGCTLLTTVAALVIPRRRLWISEQNGAATVIADSGRSGDAVRLLVKAMEAESGEN